MSLRRIVVPALLLLPLATLTAQIPQTTLSTVTATPIAVLSQVGTQSAFTVVPANTPVAGTPNTVNINARLDQGGYASATTIAYPTQPYQGSIGLNFFERAYARGTAAEIAGTSSSAQQNGAMHGPHALLLTFRNAPGTAGRIVFNFRASTTGAVAGSIDIGDDGNVEFAATAGASREFPFTFGPSGQVVVRVTNDCRATGTGNPNDFVSAWTEIWTGFRPDLTAQCTITAYGTACGGVTANGAEVVIGSSRVLTFLVNGAFANSVVLAASGDRQLGVQLPGGCSLLCNATGVRLLQSDSLGNATDSYAIPATAVGTSWFQFLPLDLLSGNLVLTASNGLRVDCVR